MPLMLAGVTRCRLALLVLLLVYLSTGSANTQSNNDKTHISTPQVPPHFRLKARVWMSHSDHPMLVLFHYDQVNQRSREDFYYLTDGRHQRFYTSIKYLDQDINYSIYHKQQLSPRACFIVPASSTALDMSALSRSVFLGQSIVDKYGQNHTCSHFRVNYHGHDTHFCLDSSNSAPVIFESDAFRVDILDFEVVPQAASVFDPKRASKAPCAVISSSAYKKQKPEPRPF